jgi:hypothetical protein
MKSKWQKGKANSTIPPRVQPSSSPTATSLPQSSIFLSLSFFSSVLLVFLPRVVPISIQFLIYSGLAKFLSQKGSSVRFRHVIIGDIASRNDLLDKDKSVKLCDFSGSGLIPLDVDMEKAEDNIASTSTDIFQFGSLVYEILTGQPCKYDLFANEEIERQSKINEATTNREPEATLPQPDRLPATGTLALSEIIRKCWSNQYQTMKEVCLPSNKN